MSALSVCETDLKVISGVAKARKIPIILGHEGGGTVERVGENVRGLAVGDHVLVDPNSFDYTCPQCRSGKYQLCENGGLMGREVDGLFADRIDTDARHLYRVPKGVDNAVVPLLQPLSTAVHAQRKLEIQPADVVVIIGLGPAGLMLAKIAEARGATVMGVEISKKKLELSKSFGVRYPVDATGQDVSAELKEVSGGTGADVVIEATGNPKIFRQSFDYAKPGGVILQFGISNSDASFEMDQLYDKELRIIGTRSSIPSDFVTAINMVASGKIDLAKLITRTFRFDEMDAAIRLSADKIDNIKVNVTL
jgi:L-iditol 2-dehydrogenase